MGTPRRAAFWLDLIDARAAVRSDGASIWDVLRLTVPALVAVLPLYGPVSDALVNVPGAARIVRLGLPAALFAYCWFLVSARAAGEPGVGFTAGEAKPTYRHAAAIRLVAKVALPLLLALLGFLAWDLLPNNVWRRTTVAGYVCRADTGKPIADAPVELVDSLGVVSSALLDSTDDTGFVVIPLDAWAQRPVQLRLRDAKCAGAVPLASATSGAGCPSEHRPLPARDAPRIWSVPCHD